MTDEDIVASVVSTEDPGSSEGEDEVPVKKVKISTLRTYIDALLDYTTYSKYPEIPSHYNSLRMVREIIIKEQYSGGTQTKVSSFFTPVRPQSAPNQTPASGPAPASPQPGTSGQSSSPAPAPASPLPASPDIDDSMPMLSGAEEDDLE